MIFRGTFEHSLDAKHRLTVPSKFRLALAGGVVLALTTETEKGSGARSLSIWPAEDYAAFAERVLAGLNPISAKARELQAMLYGNAWDLELDSANRLMIPSTAMAFAGLTKDVVVTGAGLYLGLWDRAVHTQFNEAVMERFPDLVASLDHTD